MPEVTAHSLVRRINAAAAHLMLRQMTEAEQECGKALSIDPKCTKALIRYHCASRLATLVPTRPLFRDLPQASSGLIMVAEIDPRADPQACQGAYCSRQA